MKNWRQTAGDAFEARAQLSLLSVRSLFEFFTGKGDNHRFLLYVGRETTFVALHKKVARWHIFRHPSCQFYLPTDFRTCSLLSQDGGRMR